MHEARDYCNHLEFGREQADNAPVESPDKTVVRFVDRVRQDQRGHLQFIRAKIYVVTTHVLIDLREM